MNRYLIAYDIASSSTRNKVATRLEKAGQRVQKSVFMVQCSPEKCQQLVQDLLEIIEADDSLLCLPVCEHCFRASLISAPKVPLIGYF